jgi:hypothetical protein
MPESLHCRSCAHPAYENGKTLPGYFMRASATGGPRPTLMILGGGDTTCEEL